MMRFLFGNKSNSILLVVLITFFVISPLSYAQQQEDDDCSCTNYDLFEFENCSFKAIRMTIGGGMSQIPSCTHSFFDEIKCITGTNKNKAAKKAIMAKCEGEEEEEDTDPPIITTPPDTPPPDDETPSPTVSPSSSPSVSPSASSTTPIAPDTCIDWENGLQTENGCTYNSVLEIVTNALNNNNDCSHDAEEELRRVFRLQEVDEVKNAIKSLCTEGWKDVDKTSFADIDSRFTNDFMGTYVGGDTFLNLETGTFQGTVEGNNIKNFHDNQAKETKMKKFPELSQCKLNSMMCCFGRDRQPNDNNGNCADPIQTNCVDADPADNSNLCYTNHDRTTYPGNREDDIHCHGLAWADETTDFTNQLKYNNLFYVSLYDHMYQRGYVENVVDDEQVAMCECLEEISVAVSRSDCTQIDATLTFTLKYDDNNDNYELIATPSDDLKIEFNSCEGINPGNGQTAQGNDLASYIYRLYKEEKIQEETMNEAYKTLVGYARPGDNYNEVACMNAYESEFPDMNYYRKWKVTNEEVGSFAGWAGTAYVETIKGDFNGDGNTDIALVPKDPSSTWTTIPVAFANGDGSYTITNNSGGDFVQWAKYGITFAQKPKQQCFVNQRQYSNDRLDNPVFNRGGYIGKVTLNECKRLCDYMTEPTTGRPCVAFEFSDNGQQVSSSSKRNCALAWGCDYTQPWGGGSVYMMNEVEKVETITGDFNGDGLTDIALVHKDQGWVSIPVAFAQGDGSWVITNEVVGDFASWAGYSTVETIVGDFNGDGNTDIALVHKNQGWVSVPVAFAQGDGSWVITNEVVGDFAGWAGFSTVETIIGDLNGDGNTDIALVNRGGSWTTIPIAFAQGDGSWTITNQNAGDFARWARTSSVETVTGDFNGDGMIDIALVNRGGSWTTIPIAFAQGDGSWTITNQNVGDFARWARTNSVETITGDFNGDGMTDITLVNKGEGWTTIPIAFADGDNGQFTITNNYVTIFAQWARTTSVETLTGDFDGDGSTDIGLIRKTSGWATIPIAFANWTLTLEEEF